MRTWMIISLMVLGACVPSIAQRADGAYADYRVVPLPTSIQMDTTHAFTLQSGMGIDFDASQPELQRNAAFLQQWVEELTGLHLLLTPGAKKAAIQLRLSEKVTAQEAYTIAINKKGVLVQAASPVGIFRAIQTLRKSLPLSSPSSLHPSPVTLHLPYATISDSPRFSYRGVHLDCARHFFSVDVIKRYLD